MTEPGTAPIDVVEAFLAAFAAMDFDTALTFLSDDVEYTNIPLGTVHGHAGVREVLEPFFAPIHENEFLISRRAATGPVVFLERLDRHRLEHDGSVAKPRCVGDGGHAKRRFFSKAHSLLNGAASLKVEHA